MSLRYHFVHSTIIHNDATMDILCWNIREVCSNGKVFQLIELYCKTKPCIIGLVETKHTDFSKTLLSKWWKEKDMSL